MKKLLIVLMVVVVVILSVLMVRRVIRRSSFRNQPAWQTVNRTNRTNNQSASDASLSIDDELKQLDNLMGKDNTGDLNPNDITNLQQ